MKTDEKFVQELIKKTKKARKKPTQNRMHKYYTPNTYKFQVLLYIFTIFVNYADNLCKQCYVN